MLLHRLAAAGLAVGSVLALGAVPALRTAAERAADPGPALAPGVLLVAAPGLRDPNFEDAVILVTRRDRAGTRGIVVDVPPPDLGPPRPWWGGPVSPGLRLSVVPAVTPLARAVSLPGGLTVSPDAWGVPGGRRFAGAAGWGPGDLAREVRQGTWIVVPGGAARVLTGDPGDLWARLAGEGLRRFTLQ